MPDAAAESRATTESAPAGRVLLHVGAPKTGTTFLQNVLWHNRSTLAANGVLYPLSRPMEHFDATMDLREMKWNGVRKPEWDGAWERLAARVRAWSGGTAIISNEILGGATVDQIERAVESLRPARVEVVFTARDLARQLASGWQEHLKHRLRVPFEQFVGNLVELGRDTPEPYGEMFWTLNDVVEILARWEKVVPRQHIHLVTVPQRGAPVGLLWNRFASVLGVDAADFDCPASGANQSMGVAQSELLRRVNVALADDALWPHSDQLIRVVIGERILAHHSRNAPRLAIPAPRLAWATDWAREQVEALRGAGYDVVGDLAELVPVPLQTTPLQPEDVPEEDLVDPAIAVITGLLEELARERDVVAGLRRAEERPFRAWLDRKHPRVAGSARRALHLGRRLRRR